LILSSLIIKIKLKCGIEYNNEISRPISFNMANILESGGKSNTPYGLICYFEEN